jgi:inorganic triphosphatase YgiF
MSSEIELKLLLPGMSARSVLQTLDHHPALARKRRREQWLTNIYFDTPEHTLRQARAALRLRHVAESAGKRSGGSWVQTFKTAGTSHGGLSERGEWESPISGAALDPLALAATPWQAIDRDGRLLATLAPVFETRCHRTTWLIRRRNGTQMEVALDVGDIVAGDRHEPMLELELELVAGDPNELFQLAQTLAKHLPLLPCDASKAERGYALAAGQPHPPVRARMTRLSAHTSPLEAARQTMGDMLEQLTRNATGLLHRDDPELVHQARVAWRRWRSALRLFSPWLPQPPDRKPLAPLLQALGQLRDLDVARVETLPFWLPAFAGSDKARRQVANAAIHRLDQACAEQRNAVRLALGHPETGQTLLNMAMWLHNLTRTSGEDSGKAAAQRTWARERVDKLQRRLAQAVDAARQPDADETLGHEARLLAKRTRYSVEALQGLLPKDKSRQWLRKATDVQTSIGLERDLEQAVNILQALKIDPTLVAFLRGVCAARHAHEN